MNHKSAMNKMEEVWQTNPCAIHNLPVPGKVVEKRAMIDWNQCPEIERNASKVGGAWIFKGTRIPVRALFENLNSGARVEDFLEWFPGVKREQVTAVLRHIT
jgi:uncharacterized protein (DUF433 family)